MLPLSNFVDAWRGPIPEIHVSISIHFSSKHQKLHLVGSNVYPTPSLSFISPCPISTLFLSNSSLAPHHHLLALKLSFSFQSSNQ